MAIVNAAAKRKEQAAEAQAELDAAIKAATVDEPVIPDGEGDEPLQADTSTEGEPDIKLEEKPQDNTEIEQLKADIERLNAILSDENSQTYKSRWEALKGQFQGKRQEIDELTGKVAKLEGKIEQLAAKPNKEPEPAPKMEDDPEFLEDSEEFGPTKAKRLYLDRQRLAELEKKFGTIDNELKATKGKATEIEQKTGKIEEYQAATAAERYAASEAQAVPDWDVLMGTQDKNFTDQNPKFTEFLNKRTRGKTNIEWLKDFKTNWDVTGVKAIFDEGREYAGLNQEVIKPEGEKKPSKADKYIEPGKTATGTREPGGQPPMILESEIDAFEKQLRLHTYKGTAAEKEALKLKYRDARINQRVIEGR